MKSMGSGVILKSKTVTPIECLHFAMNQPASVVITGIDAMPILYQAIEAALTFRPMTKEEVSALLSKTAGAAARISFPLGDKFADGRYELFKTTAHFDSTAKHPDWLGGETEDVRKLAPGPS
jgi:hypothetical protein